jgi:hypothetical protein
LGGKWEEVKKNLLLFLPLATKLGTFYLATKFGSTFTSLLLLFKRRLKSLGVLFFPGHNFHFNLENICFHKLIEEEKNDQSW